MTGFQLQREFERLLQARNIVFEFDEKPDTETIFGFLNIAQLRLLKQKYIPSANTEENITSIQNNSEDLKNLIVFVDITPATSVYSSYTQSCAYPSDYLHYIRSDSAALVRGALTTGKYPNKLVSWREMDKVISNTYNTPIIRKPFVVLGSTDMLITRDVYTTISVVTLTYLKAPAEITLASAETDIDLAPYLHEDIAQLAVTIFEQQRLTSNDSKGNG